MKPARTAELIALAQYMGADRFCDLVWIWRDLAHEKREQKRRIASGAHYSQSARLLKAIAPKRQPMLRAGMPAVRPRAIIGGKK